MTQTRYPYLSLTVLPELQKHVIAPNAAVLFDEQLKNVLWANGEGSLLIGATSLRSALDGEHTINPAMLRQIKGAAENLDDQDDATALMRVSSGFKTRLIGFTVRKLTLPLGETGILLLSESMHGRHHDPKEMAQAAVDCLNGYSHASAIVSAEGTLDAQSDQFSDLGVAEDEIARLVNEVATESDRLVKRPIETARGQLPAGIARLGDTNPIHLLVIASSEPDTQETTVSSPLDDSASEDTDLGGEKSETSKEHPSQAKESEAVSSDVRDAPIVGAFSSKRKGTVSRWYFKAPKTDTNDTDQVDDEQADTANVSEMDAGLIATNEQTVSEVSAENDGPLIHDAEMPSGQVGDEPPGEPADQQSEALKQAALAEEQEDISDPDAPF